ncbi:MAG: Protein, probably involved in Fe2+ transport [Caldanaerobacter subterraneus]|jgi:ferrous iron transport protein A|uniref:FeoA family protein n=2 Tax=Caldanaerobacter subterraneus TaxID=911092 RepID=U5CX37_CALSX|nr:FeoA family protein [Caldanaerobacter subterraneus]ERM92592.1 FeoA family protein [Caldanaerobacter subterraneus subsp. yonseiensis KB-1]KUK07879.1 MAG: Protein, probably involved in Fe2+ transport [Caldanaerobacter subterraneus]
MMVENEVINLLELRENEEGEIVFIDAGRMAAQRLSDMGLVPGTRVKLVRRGPLRGPVELEVRNSHLVIGYGLASKIYVKIA